jgi:hypothetical protein
MKILLINNGMHIKNFESLLKYNIDITVTNNYNLDIVDLSQYDAVYSPCGPIDVKKYPNIKFIFGPHFSVFPEKKHMDIIRGKNVIYTQPSVWAADVWKTNHLCEGIRVEPLPFGVDTNKFNETKIISEREYIFVYYKARKYDEINYIMNFLSKFNYKIKVFNYLQRYNEEDYINCLHNAKFGVWVGRHESQGFALEEALSCNVPLLVWDVTSMNQEYGYNYPDIPATCIPYWDNRCGEFFTNSNELETVFNKFIDNLYNYKPREYILENLSIIECEKKFIQLIKSN